MKTYLLTEGCCQPYAPAALYPQKDLLALIYIRGWVNPSSIVRLEWLGKLQKNLVASLGLEPVTFRLVAQRLNHPPKFLSLQIAWAICCQENQLLY
jgi:hypothetical protein